MSTPCRYFVSSGVCFYGQSCKFAHSTASVIPPAASAPLTTTVTESASSPSDIDPLAVITGPPFRLTQSQQLVGVFSSPSQLLGDRRRAPISAADDTTPLTVDGGRYHSLMRPSLQSQMTTEYTAVDSVDGADVMLILLPREFTALSPQTKRVIRRWTGDDEDTARPPTTISPTICRFRRCFRTTEFIDGAAVVAVYDHCTAQRSLREIREAGGAFDDDVVWAVLCQVVNALTALHSNQLAFDGAITADTVALIGAANRIRLLRGGMTDMIAGGDTVSSLEQRQDDDIAALGRLMLYMTASSTSSTDDIGVALLEMSRNRPADLCTLTTRLVSVPPPPLSTVVPHIAHRLQVHHHDLTAHVDSLESLLARAMENGRLFRLLLKINMIERTAFHDGWNDTGERYLIELFRRLLFDSTIANAQDNNNIDIAFAVDLLNKVDCGSDDKVILSGNDGESVMVVRYSDIKRAIDRAALHVTQNAIMTATTQ